MYEIIYDRTNFTIVYNDKKYKLNTEWCDEIPGKSFCLQNAEFNYKILVCPRQYYFPSNHAFNLKILPSLQLDIKYDTILIWPSLISFQTGTLLIDDFVIYYNDKQLPSNIFIVPSLNGIFEYSNILELDMRENYFIFANKTYTYTKAYIDLEIPNNILKYDINKARQQLRTKIALR